MIPQAWRDTGIWLAIAGLAVVPILRVRFPLFDTTIGVKGLVGILEAIFVLAVFTRYRSTATDVILSWIVAGLLAWGFTIAALSDHPAAALVRQAEWLAHMLFAFAVFVFVRARADHARLLVLAVAAGLVLYAVEYSVLRWTLPWPVDEHGWETGTPGFSNVRHLGYWVMAMVPLCLYAAMHEDSRRAERALVAVALTLSWGFLFWAGGRGPLYALIAGGIPVLLLPGRSEARRAAIWLAGTAAGGFVLSMLHAVPGLGLARIVTRSVQVDSITDMSPGRFRMWEHAIDAITNAPVTGLGPDGLLFTPAVGLERLVQPHGILVQAPLEWGLPGAALFFMIIAVVLYVSVRSAVRPIIWALLSLLALSLIDGPLYHAQSTMLAALCAGIAMSGRPGTGSGGGMQVLPCLAGCFCAMVFALHTVSVAQAINMPSGSPGPPVLLVKFPSGMSDHRAAMAMRQRMINCLEHGVEGCERLVSIASAQSRPPVDQYFGTVHALLLDTGDDAALRHLMDKEPWPVP